MPLIRPLTPAFSSGEVSPPIYARIDLARYRSSLRKCRNFIVQPHGGVSNRPGTRFVAETKYSTLNQSVVLQEFIFNQETAYILEFGDEYVRFYTNGARLSMSASDVSSWNAATSYVRGDYAITTPASTVYYLEADTSQNQNPALYPQSWTASTVYERPTPYEEADLDQLRFESSADVIYITHPDYQPRTLTRNGATDWDLELYDPVDGPFAPENIEDISITASTTSHGFVNLTANAPVWSSTDVGALFKLTHLIEGSQIQSTLTSATVSSSINVFTTWRLVTHGTWTARFDVEKSIDDGISWTTIRSFDGTNDRNIDTSGTEDPEIHLTPFKVRVNVTNFGSGSLTIHLSADEYYQDGIAEITTYSNAASIMVNTLSRFGSTNSTDIWAHGAWSATRGYPAVSRFFQDRLCFASTDAEPQTIWMTQTSNYVSFLRHSTLLDTDGITINLPSRQVNKINGLIALTRLLVFTGASEWSVGSTSTGVITPTTIDTRIEGYRGSSGLVPVVVGNEIIYVQSNGKTVRNLGFELASESFTGDEINILAKHMFDKWTIQRLAYAQDPDSVIWVLRSDGKLLACTYNRAQEVIAWSQHDTGADE